jgi:hypothetical protein
MFDTVSYFHPCLIFASKAKSLPLEWSHNTVQDRAFPSNIKLGLKWLAVANALAYNVNYERKKFYCTGTLRNERK